MPALPHGCDARVVMDGLAVTEYAREDEGASIKNVDIAAEPGQNFVITTTCGVGNWTVHTRVDGTLVGNFLFAAGPTDHIIRGYEQGVARLPFRFAELAIAEENEGASLHPSKLVTKPGCIEVTFTKVTVKRRTHDVGLAPPVLPPAAVTAAANSKAGINGVRASVGAAEASRPQLLSPYVGTPTGDAPLVARFRYLAAAFIPELVKAEDCAVKEPAAARAQPAKRAAQELADLKAEEAELLERARVASARMAALRNELQHNVKAEEPQAKPEPVTLSIDLTDEGDDD